MLNHYSHVRLDARRIALEALASGSASQSTEASSHVTKHVTNDPNADLNNSQPIENLVDVTGIEPVTPCLQSRCSPS
jgi:hypothetical protein